MSDDGRVGRARCRGDRGTTFVAALVVMFTVTGAAALYLTRDVNQRVSDRSAMQSIAFQSARAAAQQLDVAGLRDPARSRVRIDTVAAGRAATATVGRLATHYDLDVRIVHQFPSHGFTAWTVEVATPDGALRACGVARAEAGG